MRRGGPVAAGGDGRRPSPTRGIAEVLRLARDVRRLHVQLERMEEKTHEVAVRLGALARALTADSPSRTVVDVVALRFQQEQRKRRRAQRAAAAAGITEIDIQHRARGGALVRIGNSQWITLTPLLASLLSILLASPLSAPDGFPAWQTKDRVLEQLARKRGRPLTSRALTEAVYRLRQLMVENAVNPFVLQVEARRGLRLLIRRADRPFGAPPL